MCKYLYWDKGHRSFGDNIPSYAQGAYFPGDEPGWKCWLTRDVCPAESVEDEEDCPAGGSSKEAQGD